MENDKSTVGLTPFFDRRMLKNIRKEKEGYFSFSVAYGEKGDLPYLLNESGFDIVKLCDGKHGVSDVIYEMSKLYKNVELGKLKTDVKSFLQHLSDSSALVWIGEKWIPHSSWVERIDGEILAACDSESSFLVSKFLTDSKNMHVLLASDADGHNLDPILYGGRAKSSLTFALLDLENSIRLIVAFSLVGYGKELYLNLDRIDLRNDSGMKSLNSVLRTSIQIINSMVAEQSKPTMVRTWVCESLPLKNKLIECLSSVGFTEELKMDTGLSGACVTAYAQGWKELLRGVA